MLYLGLGVFLFLVLIFFIILYFKISGSINSFKEQFILLRDSIKDSLELRLNHSEALIKQLETRVASLERIFTSRASGASAEKIAENWLSLLPPERLARNVRLGKGIVEFALKLKNGAYVPIDSKFFHLETVKNPSEILQRIRERAKEVASYLKDEKAIGLGLMVVPQGIFPFLKTYLFEELEKQGILIVSYEMLLPVSHLIYYFFEKTYLEETHISTFITILEREFYQLEKATSQLLKEIKASENLTLKIREILTYLQKELKHVRH